VFRLRRAARSPGVKLFTTQVHYVRHDSQVTFIWMIVCSYSKTRVQDVPSVASLQTRDCSSTGSSRPWAAACRVVRQAHDAQRLYCLHLSCYNVKGWCWRGCVRLVSLLSSAHPRRRFALLSGRALHLLLLTALSLTDDNLRRLTGYVVPSGSSSWRSW
jgi:hypothetical protein